MSRVAFFVTRGTFGQFGDSLEIHTTVAQESDYRLVFQQEARKDKRLLVSGMIQLACVDASKSLGPIPAAVVTRLEF